MFLITLHNSKIKPNQTTSGTLSSTGIIFELKSLVLNGRAVEKQL